MATHIQIDLNAELERTNQQKEALKHSSVFTETEREQVEKIYNSYINLLETKIANEIEVR